MNKQIPHIISTIDRRRCLEIIGRTLGAQSEFLDRVYNIDIRFDNSKKPSFTIDGLLLYINRSQSLREIADTSLQGLPRYSKYLVYKTKDKSYLLYNVTVQVLKEAWPPYHHYVCAKAELAIPTNDVFEAIRFIDNNIIEDMYMEEYARLFNNTDKRLC